MIDFDGLGRNVQALQDAFSLNFYHTFAVMANALRSIRIKLETSGIGAEVASPGELELSLSAGFTPDRIIFDSPAKTVADLRGCMQHGISFNLDNEQELARVDALRKEYLDTASIIGFRVNPQIGSGEISSTSTATSTSKFGYPLADGNNRQRLLDIYAERPWLTSIHTHTGSQGCPLELMTTGIAVSLEFAEEVNTARGSQQIERIDIGGGLPVNFKSEEMKPTFKYYADVLRAKVPVLFKDKYQVKAEFGRSIAGKNGFIITRVEYTKESGRRHIAITHAGAQVTTRNAFLPQYWPIRDAGFSPDGEERSDNPVQTDVAGPCCFAADLITKDALLPKMEPNDYVVVYDTGAYYFSNHFDYNSLPRVVVYSAETTFSGLELTLIRRAETLADVVQNMS